MHAERKSILVSVLFVLLSAFVSALGVATIFVTPFGIILSVFSGITLILSGIILWGWSCFARREIYE